MKLDIKNLLNSIGFTSQNHQQNNQAPDGSDISMNCSKINEISETKPFVNTSNTLNTNSSMNTSNNMLACKPVDYLNFKAIFQTIQSMNVKQSDYDNKLTYLKRFDCYILI